MRILCIDDDPVTLKLYQKIFSRQVTESVELQSADTAGSGLEALRAAKFDCLVVDLGLPDMSGHEVIRRARKIDPHLAIIVVTAQEALHAVIQAMNLGAQAYLRKPISSSELVSKVRELRASSDLNLKQQGVLKQRLSLRAQITSVFTLVFSVLIALSLFFSGAFANTSQAWWSLMAGIGGVLITSLYISEWLLRPIHRLVKAVDIIGKGDYKHRISVTSGNEMGHLAYAFNQMSESLARRKNQIEALNETAKSLHTTSQLSGLMEKALLALGDIISPKRCAILLSEENAFRIHSLAGLSEADKIKLLGISLPISHPLWKPVLSSKKSAILKIDQEMRDDEVGRVLTEGIDDLICVPLGVEGKIRGMLLLVGKAAPDNPVALLTSTDLEFGEALGSSISISLANQALILQAAQNARIEAELQMAELVQRTLLPTHTLSLPGIELAEWHRPASETGGDFYAFFEDEVNQRLFVFVGDVTGHGVPAALIAAMASGFVRSLELLQSQFYRCSLNGSADKLLEETASEVLSPAGVLRVLNEMICKVGEGRMLMTMHAACIDLLSMRLRYANAGHEMPLWIREGTAEVLVGSGLRLGDQTGASFEEREVRIHSGDVVLWYTDGLIDCNNAKGQAYGFPRLLRLVRKQEEPNAEEICRALESEVNAYVQNTPLGDDVMAVAVRIG